MKSILLFLICAVLAGCADPEELAENEAKRKSTRQVTLNFCSVYDVFIDTHRRICWAERTRSEDSLGAHRAWGYGYAMQIDCNMAKDCLKENNSYYWETYDSDSDKGEN